MCKHSKVILNRYTKKWVRVDCGKCPTCMQKKAMCRATRIRNNMQAGEIVLFVTLTYDELHLPRLIRADYFDKTGTKVEAYRNADSSFLIPFHDLKFEKPADLDYFNKKMHAGGVPYADFRDVQAFNHCKWNRT